MKIVFIHILLFFPLMSFSQINVPNSLLRLHKPFYMTSPEYIDLDFDKDPDMIKAYINDTILIYWIDDDDDMGYNDLEGDLDNDCLIIDRNNDGIFAGPGDLSLDWVDSNNDGIADMQVVVDNCSSDYTRYMDWGWEWDWRSNYMWIIDTEHDETFHYIDWKELLLKCWDHSGMTNFYEDYHGQTLFLKAHIPGYRFSDLRYSWENPFLFYDIDNDGLTEVSIRLADSGRYEKDKSMDSTAVNTWPTAKIDQVHMGFDLDNDNRAGNEFDFDMSLHFSGEGFSYAGQVHHFDNMKGLSDADSLFFDNRWRQMDELFYTNHDSAWNFVFNKGKWEFCWFVFDEDDDCGRWERVELYQPKNPFIIGAGKGGIDNHGQADVAGDRGEWDMDNSGQGNLYIGFDGKIHLYGAEKGYWRIDQDAISYQESGYYLDREREQHIPEKFATIAYEDTNNDGFFNQVKFDLDGDTQFEESFNLADYNMECQYEIYKTAPGGYLGFNELFRSAVNENWENALSAVEAAQKFNINYKWYSRFLQPGSMNEKYQYAWWLQFYLFTDFLELAKQKNGNDLKKEIVRAYFTGNWEILAGLIADSSYSNDKVFSEYKEKEFTFKGHTAKIVYPNKKSGHNYWIWRARFWGHEPQVDKALLEKGFHVTYIDVADLFGSNEAVELWNQFYDYCINEEKLNHKVVLEGMSRGGLIIYNWASKNTDKVACIYADAPVCDIKSWPGGMYSGNGSPADWETCLKVYHLDANSVLNFEDIPLNNCVKVATAGIPVMHVFGDADKVVPYEENTALLAEKFKEAGDSVELIRKEGVGHHPHCLKDPKPIIDFILNSIKKEE